MKIGTDIIQIERVRKMVEKYGIKFQERFLTDSEIDESRKVESIAGLWAAKEAIAKALGCGIGAELAFHDIIIYKDQKGAPHFKLSPQAQARHQIKNSSLSISHDGGFAISIVVIEV
ncbi:holo-ACP synthase [Sulfurovum sp. zt1-1]|uniref:Holo-[acyl-carrier-protein] synthase n=1 Tax=Sulfurovum zhangzhouensis TaxID=3019067 RepID=A0ABT7QZU3_9BACT|nr:holo-ACP synthase [Sulfurovum zhangzhouensis]MDM5272049.1 holo-ACP synthase [Sulfurovum zhangzhouensis]